MMTARIPCCVPFCRRTASREKFPHASEIICAKHYRLADKKLRILYRKITRQLEGFNEMYPTAYPADDKLKAQVIRREKQWPRIWARIKTQAIEAAGGLR